MNRKMLQLLAISVALLALLIGCGAQEDATAKLGDVADKAKEVAGDVVDDAKEAVEGVAAEGFEAVKTEAVTALKTSVEEWTTKITDVDAKVAALPEIAQKPLQEPVKALKDKGAALVESVTGLEGATEENFDAQKTKVEDSMGEVKTAYDQVMGLF